MQVAMISDFEDFGGAAIAAGRLAAGLRQLGHAVRRIVAIPSSAATEATVVAPQGAGAGVLRRLPTVARADLAVRPAVGRRLDAALVQDVDVVSVHNLHAAFHLGWSIDVLERADRFAPTLWTLHDMWSFTGRCAYSHDCRLFEHGCDATCPTPHEYPALHPGRIAGEWAHRRDAVAATRRTAAVAPSRWLAQEAARGLWGPRVHCVPYGLPLDEFVPRDTAAAKAVLDLPTGHPVLLTSAVELDDPRKGTDILARALESTSRPLTLLTMGSGTLRIANPKVRVIPLGSLGSTQMQAVAYNAADLLVHPARADNLPLVVQESIACGTPVVAFDVGGLADMVRPETTGWLAAPGPDGLAGAIVRALEEGPAELAGACRDVAEREWGLEKQAEQYVALWHGLS